jgi:hypothetical protein
MLRSVERVLVCACVCVGEAFGEEGLLGAGWDDPGWE